MHAQEKYGWLARIQLVNICHKIGQKFHYKLTHIYITVVCSKLQSLFFIILQLRHKLSHQTC